MQDTVQYKYLDEKNKKDAEAEDNMLNNLERMKMLSGIDDTTIKEQEGTDKIKVDKSNDELKEESDEEKIKKQVFQMNNAEILRERWKNTDKYLLKYLKKYKIINRNTRDNIQNVFNELNIDYKDINKNISKQQKNKLDRFILNLKKNKLLKDYFGYKARLIFSKKSFGTLNVFIKVL